MTKARDLAVFNAAGVLTSTSNLNASKLTSGTIPNARYGTPTFDGSNLTGIDAGGNTPAFQAYMNGNQTLSSGSYQKMQMDTEVFDTDSKYSTSSYRFTPTVAGKYWVWGKFRMDTGASIAASIIAVYKNGSILSKFTEGQSNSTTKFFGQVITLDSNDYIELYGYQNSGSNAAVNGGAENDQDTGHWGAYKIA